MNTKSNYTSTIFAKNGTEIPVFSDGRTVDSKYNPEREAKNLISSSIKSEKDNPIYKDQSFFFIVIGIGSGTLIEKLSQEFTESKIMAVEATDSDLQFLSKLEKIKKLKTNKNIILTDINNIECCLTNHYLPALYKKLHIIEQRGWIEENKNYIKLINEKINKAIGIISADFSVQAHFGKIWQCNIINNLKTLISAENKLFPKIDINKTAAVVAAGPSLDLSIKKIINKRDKYFIISTDTAFSVLVNNNIIPEIVISIDGQHISHNHFSHLTKCKNTMFIMDLCSDFSTGKFLNDNNFNTVYFTSGHPLATMANNLSNKKFLNLFSGAGTVTITSLDLALKIGFSNIEIFGADFSYSKGKAYTKGTYFDTIFSISSSRLISIEKQYTKLMMRTELEKISDNEYSTGILSAYKISLEQFLADNKCSFAKEDNIYYVKSSNNANVAQRIINLMSFPYDFDNFMESIKNADITDLTYPLLPYIAWLKSKKNNESLKFIALLKLAQSNIVGYN